MKNTKILLLVLFLFIPELYSQVQSGWYWVNPQPQGHNLTSVTYLNNNTLIAVGWNGTILRSTNGGQNWSNNRYSTTRDFNKVKFFDQNTGYAIGDSSLIFKTTDSGLNWTRLNYYSNDNFRDLSFINISTGYFASYSKLLKTTNGGVNFESVPNTGGVFVQFVDSETGYCGGNGVKKTTNGGINWINISNVSIYGGYFFDSNNGIITGSDSIFKTSNGGVSWSSSPGFSFYPITTMKFVNSSTGYASSLYGGNFYKTTNGGNVWSQIIVQNPDLFASGFDFIDVNNILIVSRYGLIEKTSNGGVNWQNYSNILYSSVNSICFPNMNTGFASGDKYFQNKSIFKTTDQGSTWFELTSIPDSNFRSIFFIDANTGFAGGYYGSLYKTTNSGQSWIQILLQHSIIIRDIRFINSTTGFISSSQASIYKTTNTGVNWNRVNFNMNDGYLFNLSFPSQMTGYAAGEVLYKTTNGGDNWFNLQNPVSSTLNWSLYFLDENTGFLGGNFGEISRTTNGGNNWNTIQTNLQFALTGIHFINNNTGFIVGLASVNTTDIGLLLKTTNNGLNWQRQNLIANQYLNDIYFINNLTGFIAGQDGLILKTTTGGEFIGINQISNEIPKNYYLQQNYPNPFNPTTNIKFDIPGRSNVKISIYDILGKEISVLVDEELNPGTFEVNWDASNFPSGVYFYKIETDEFSESKKMIMIK